MMKNEKKRAAFLTLGCKVNAYETDAMKRLFIEAGYEIVDFKETAQVYIINTCTVTNMADRKSRQMLHRAKKQNPGGVIAAVGCYVQAAGEELKKDICVDLLVGNNQKHRIVELVEDYFSGKEPESFLEAMVDIGREQEYEALSIDVPGEKTRAYLKIQDGCNQFCSYCIIPYARGRVRSRKPGEILTEAAGLVAKGYREIVLTGIHLSSYGVDLEPWREKGKDFVLLKGEPLLDLVADLSRIEGLERIRLGSLEPRIITREFVKRLSGFAKVCPHFHLSLQSGCDATLIRMNRKYTTQDYRKSCDILREQFDNPALSTDVIVGFPGESPGEFTETEQFLEEIAFASMHIFKYSKRKGTKAASMEEQIPEAVKNQRSDRLLSLEKELGKRYRSGFLGTIQRILLEEEISREGKIYWTGHNERYVKLAVEGSKPCPSGTIAEGMVMKELAEGILLCRSSKG